MSVFRFRTRSLPLFVLLMILACGTLLKAEETSSPAWALSTRLGDTFAYHSGSNPGFRCYSRFDRKAGSGVVIMTNAESGAKVWAGLIEALNAPSSGQSNNSAAKD